MGYSNDVIVRARRQLEANNNQARSLGHRRLMEAYERVPRIKEIDVLLRRSMALAAQAAFAKGEQAVQIMEDAKNANLQLQAERKQLVEENFPANWLEEDSICGQCGGTGYIGRTMCSCLNDLCRQEQQKEVSLLSCGVSRFVEFKLEYYPDRIQPGTQINIRDYMAKTLETCRRYAANFPGEQGNLLFSGNTGLGKTFLSACIATEVTEKGCSVAYESAPHLFANLEKAKFTADPELRAQAEAKCSKYTACDLLILDDLGTELSGQFVTAALYSLINDRILMGKSTIISTNLNNEEIENRYSPQILSRIRGHFRRVGFVGDDIRVLKSKGNL